MSFVGLHVHSDYSLLDGASQLPQLIARAVELGMPAIALTDHGVMYGAIELIKICKAKGIKPIIGNEMYLINGDITQQQKLRRYHQIVLAKNTQGYKNLVKLTTVSHLKGRQGKGIFSRPCINKELLEQYSEGLIVTSGCLAGEIPQLILQGELAEALKIALWYKELLGNDYYLEIQDHGQWEDRIVNVEIVKIAQQLEIKVVATNDSHFISCYDVEAHDALLCINTNKLITEDKRLRYTGTEYLKSADEMAQLFRDHLPDEVIEEAIANTLEVAAKVESYDIMGAPRLPNYPVPGDRTPNSYLAEIARDGLRDRFGCGEYLEVEQTYRDRLEFELKVIQDADFATYFLVVWDYIKYAKDNKIPVGPGRGSAAGSLVAYALRITEIDPIHHGLLFERFLNPERKSMPDIDTDFCIENRDKVIKYVTQKYGSDRVAQIITFNKLVSKSVLKDVGRVLNVPYGESDKMTKLIPVVRGKPTKLKAMVSDATPCPEFKAAYDSKEVRIQGSKGEEESAIAVSRWVDMAMRIEGTNKTYGVHAAGVVISAEPLDEIVPLQLNNDGAVITQYSMENIEDLGLLKMDFLGLKNLTIIQKTIDLVKENQGICIDLDEAIALGKSTSQKKPEQIQNVYKALETGQLQGIFQLESSGMKQVVRDLKPSSIEDLSSILALYRPGPLDAGLIPKFIDRKHGREAIDYPHPLLEPILKETYGILCYQEQIMKMAQNLAGYSLAEADLLRRAMGKKKAEEMEKQRSKFMSGAIANNIPRKTAELLFEQMVQFCEYSFNQSHSMAYAYVTYQTAYLKANYKLEYMAALLTENSANTDKIQSYIASCQQMGIVVEGPDINRSGVGFTPAGNKILFGLSAVKNLGETAIASILDARKQNKFKSLPDLCDRVSINSRALESLIKCGALDSLNPNRKQSIEYIPTLTKWLEKSNEKTDQPTLFDLETVKSPPPKMPKIADFTTAEKLQTEKEFLGFYISEHPLKTIEGITTQIDPNAIAIGQLSEQQDQNRVTAIALLAEIKQITTKKNDAMAIVQIEDLTGKIEGVVFPKTYEKLSRILMSNIPLIIKGKLDKKERNQIIIDDIQALPNEEAIAQLIQEAVNNSPSVTVRYQVRIELTVDEVENNTILANLQSILEEYGGNDGKKIPVVGIISDGDSRGYVEFGQAFWVQSPQQATKALRAAGFSASFVRLR
jgi:DNA polymerase III subunit alpha